MLRKTVLLTLSLVSFLAAGAARADLGSFGGLNAKEWLGKLIFFDQNLSVNRNQACAACHAPEVGFTGPESAINATGSVYEGSIPGVFGNRKPPAAAYAGYSPILYYDETNGMWVGGMFWDGRATGWDLQDPLAEQAKGPFLNDREQGLSTGQEVVGRVCTSHYGWLFKAVWGAGACSSPDAYNNVARSIAAYERSKEVNPFSSKYDAYLNGKATLTLQEAWGLELFQGTKDNPVGKGKCSLCHLTEPTQEVPVVVFTDYTYDNLGIPKNPMNPFYQQNDKGAMWVDPGLGGFLGDPMRCTKPDCAPTAEDQVGKFKVPTLRNVDRRLHPRAMVKGEPVKAYGHNGYFKSLKEIVHFYNTRDLLPGCKPEELGTAKEKTSCWPEPEYAPTMNKTELGNLRLVDAEEDAIVAFLKTLNDGWRP